MSRGDGEKFRRFQVLLSCLDFRLDEFPGLSRSTRFAYARRLRSLHREGRVYVHHLAFHRPLGVRFLHALAPVGDVARSVISMPRVRQEDLGALGVPAHWLLVSAAVLDRSRMLLEWVVPPGVDPGPMRDWVLDRGGEAWLGWKLPVQTCSPGGGVDSLGRRLRLLLAAGELRLRTPLVAYMLLAVLDKLRLVRLRDAVRLTAVALARDLEPLAPTAELRRSLVRRYYVELSRAQVLGRYRVLGSAELARARAYVAVEPGCAETLYGVAAAYGAASHVFHGGVAAAPLLVDNEVQGELAKGLGGCIVEAGLRLRSLYTAFPYELYDPLEGRWRTEPVQGFMERLARAGLLERRKNPARG